MSRRVKMRTFFGKTSMGLGEVDGFGMLLGLACWPGCRLGGAFEDIC